ncbi:MAG: ChrR family anti-sigma-E factor [Pseudomonadota bacterium]
MPKYRPDLDILIEYAAGTLPLAQAACVTAHLNYCEESAKTVQQLQAVGTALFESLDPEPVGDALLNRVLGRLDEEPPLSYDSYQDAAQKRGEKTDSEGVIEMDATPSLLRRLMDGDFTDLPWKRITDTLRTTRIKTGDPNYEFSLLHIKAGGEIPHHDHHGSEMTLVLQGGFTDGEGEYHAGDFIYKTTEDVHAPRAFDDEDCICLAVLDAPLKFTGWKYRWMNPFLRLQAG